MVYGQDDNMISLRVYYDAIHDASTHQVLCGAKTKSHDPCIFIIVTSNLYHDWTTQHQRHEPKTYLTRLDISMQTLYHIGLKIFSFFFPTCCFHSYEELGMSCSDRSTLIIHIARPCCIQFKLLYFIHSLIVTSYYNYNKSLVCAIGILLSSLQVFCKDRIVQFI